MTNELKKYREKIDEIDSKIVKLLESRFEMSHKIGEEKLKTGKQVFIPEREQAVLKRLKSEIKSSFLSFQIEKIYRKIFLASRNSQKIYGKKFHHPISIGIIGYGNFGKLLAQTFEKFWEGSEIKIFELTEKIDNQKFFKLEEVAQQTLLFPCVPIAKIPEVLALLKEFIKPETTIIDICSVKIFPITSMQKILPNTKIISSHPMYGPDSTFDGQDFCGRKIAVWNVSADKEVYELYKKFWENLGVDAIEITPDEHDKLAAFSQAYVHFIGKIGQKMGIKKTAIDTKSFSFLYDSLQMMNSDSEELFRDMMTKNPYAKEMRQKFQITLNQIESELK